MCSQYSWNGKLSKTTVKYIVESFRFDYDYDYEYEYEYEIRHFWR